MICKHCKEPVVENTVRRSYQPHVFYPWKHEGTHLFGCLDQTGEPTGTKAEPEKESE